MAFVNTVLDNVGKDAKDIISSSLDAISESFNQYIVRPINAFGLGGFVFDNEGESTVQLQSEITDHWLEDNTAVQDHISVLPPRLVLKNYVGELVYRQDDSTDTMLQNLTRKLTTIDAYLPVLTDGAKQVTKFLSKGLDNISLDDFSLSDTLRRATDLWSLTKNLNPPMSRQQQAFEYFAALQSQKIVVSVQTPFKFYNNMVVESVVAHQGEDTNTMSDFTITLKRLRYVSTSLLSGVNPDDFFGRGAVQREETTDMGRTPGTTPNRSILLDVLINSSGGLIK